MPDSVPHAEDASLYVLDLLDAEARQSFEAELENSPELRRHVADLQANLDALALSTPAVLPPPAVWSGIAQRIAAAPAVTPATAPVSLWTWIQNSLANGWAMAALVALAFLTHVAWDRFPGSASPTGDSDGFTDNGGNLGERPSGGSRLTGAASIAAARPASRGADSTNPRSGRNGVNALPSPDDAARLQDRVRMLSEQVGMLTHMLAQRAVPPAGSAQLQVFRLVSSNGLPDGSEASLADLRRTGPLNGSPQIADAGTSENPTGPGSGTDTGSTTLASASQELPFALALAAARQFASLTSPSETGALAQPEENAGLVHRNAQTPPSTFAPPTSDGTVSISDNLGAGTSSANSIQVLDLATGTSSSSGSGSISVPISTAADPTIVSSSDATAFGAYSPETGLGAIAFRAHSGNTDAEVYQLWMTDPHTGLVQSVGFSAISANSQASQVVVLRFSTTPDVLSQPSFMITREPAGGSIVPTGPIVAQPPTSTVFPPTP